VAVYYFSAVLVYARLLFSIVQLNKFYIIIGIVLLT
jgi:hypothetical protein